MPPRATIGGLSATTTGTEANVSEANPFSTTYTAPRVLTSEYSSILLPYVYFRCVGGETCQDCWGTGPAELQIVPQPFGTHMLGL